MFDNHIFDIWHILNLIIFDDKYVFPIVYPKKMYWSATIESQNFSLYGNRAPDLWLIKKSSKTSVREIYHSKYPFKKEKKCIQVSFNSKGMNLSDASINWGTLRINEYH